MLNSLHGVWVGLVLGVVNVVGGFFGDNTLMVTAFTKFVRGVIEGRFFTAVSGEAMVVPDALCAPNL